MELVLQQREDSRPTSSQSFFTKSLSGNLSTLSTARGDLPQLTKEHAVQGVKPVSLHEHVELQFNQLLSFGSLSVPRDTPPLSPSGKTSTKSIRFSSSSSSFAGKENNFLSPQEALSVLRTPGIPCLEDISRIRHMSGASSRAWLRDFLIRGGRRSVNDKVKEMTVLMDKEANRRRRRAMSVPRMFSRRKSIEGVQMIGGLKPRPLLMEIAEVREQLTQLVVFLHLRQ